jgi:hypothetical protein
MNKPEKQETLSSRVSRLLVGDSQATAHSKMQASFIWILLSCFALLLTPKPIPFNAEVLILSVLATAWLTGILNFHCVAKARRSDG